MQGARVPSYCCTELIAPHRLLILAKGLGVRLNRGLVTETRPDMTVRVRSLSLGSAVVLYTGSLSKSPT